MKTFMFNGTASMLDLIEIVQRNPRPKPWAEGEKIPWNETEFSRRMLNEHLSQEHDWASRRATTIQKQVDWIHRKVLSGEPARILDLGCGPGLYTAKLAEAGHACTGVDFSPASVEYAREYARKNQLNCSYLLEDIRTADLGSGYHLAMFIFGEFNVFSLKDAEWILKKIVSALDSEGLLVLEVHNFEVVHQMGLQPSSWYSATSGLFSDRPHLCLQENFWEENQSVATQRFFILDAQTSQVTRYAASTQAYTETRYIDMLNECGFEKIAFFPSLTGGIDPSQSDFFAILAKK
jgi:SAM-dependent methyltransferase